MTTGRERQLAALAAHRGAHQFRRLDADSPTVTLRVKAPTELLGRLDAAAAKAGVTRSEWVRQALEEALERA